MVCTRLIKSRNSPTERSGWTSPWFVSPKNASSVDSCSCVCRKFKIGNFWLMFRITAMFRNNTVNSTCEGCIDDIKCALQTTVEQARRFAAGDMSARTYLLWHLGPQNWYIVIERKWTKIHGIFWKNLHCLRTIRTYSSCRHYDSPGGQYCNISSTDSSCVQALSSCMM